MNKIITVLLLLAPMSASAITNDQVGLNSMNGTLNLGSQDIKTTIAGIINVVLGLLGVLTVLIILLGGFKWMTSQGSSDKVDEAKKLISAGIIGLVIILAAYAIARFVLSELVDATTAVPAGPI